jgi:hypothetical protein
VTHHHPTPQPTNPNPNARGLAAAPSLTVLSDQPARWAPHGKDPLTWDQARERVAAADAADGARSDLAIGDLSAWVVGPRADGVACLTPIPMPGRPNPGLIPMRKSAFRHLVASLPGKPTADYLLQLPAKLATANISVGLQRLDPDNTSKLLRLAGGEARALASEKYAPLDNDLVLDTTERVLRAMGMLRDVRVTDLAVGPTLALRVVLPGEAVAVRKGDVIQHGLDIGNGETLTRSVSVCPVTYRLVCLNGMRRWETGAAKRWSHVGDPERLRQAFTDAVPVALAEAKGLRDSMRTAVDRLVDDALGEIEGLSAFGFGVNETRAIARDLFADRGLALPAATDAWADAIATAGPVSVFDVANAITHTAQTRNVDDRLAYEEAGGAYLLRRTR